MVPNYSSLQELSNGMFYKGIASTMTDIGPQRVTPLGALLLKISLVYFTLDTVQHAYRVHFLRFCYFCVFVLIFPKPKVTKSSDSEGM